MITIEQIKAARALLGWNQENLATASGMSKPAIANFERGTASPRASNMKALQAALEEAGIEFIDDGVQLRKDTLNVQVFEGSDCIYRLWADTLAVLKEGEERLISGVNEARFMAATGDRFHKTMEKYKKLGIKGRILCLEGTTDFPDPTSQYRWVPPAIFHEVPYYVYANKYAILIWEPSPRVILIENKAVANSYRKQFEYHWQRAITPS